MQEQQYLHWKLEVDAQQILWLYFDKKESSANTLDTEVLQEFDQIIRAIEQNHALKGVVIASAKKSGFIAGANIEKFTQFTKIEEAENFIHFGQKVFLRLAHLKIPTVAMIEGFCLGGGLELALACRYRVAEDGGKTRLGLPEVLLGIHPGWGGCVRLPRLIGPIKALDLILSGRAISGKEAAALGVVDEAVPMRHLKDAAASYVLKQPNPHEPNFLQALPEHDLFRPLVAKFMRKKLANKIKPEHYPAPYAVVDNWAEYGVKSDKLFDIEVESIAKLMLGDTAKNLIRVFMLQDRLKGLAKGVKFDPQHIHVIGAGTMGGDIAAWCALRGMHVTLQDQSVKSIGQAVKRAQALFEKQLKQPRLVQEAMDRLVPDEQGNGIATADIVIEAIFEDLNVKQALLKQIEPLMKPEAILATNTSSIPLDELNQVLAKPERLVGIHFFNPVAKMRLVEVVHGNLTSEEVQKLACAFVRKIDRLPLLVVSKPGFLVNRILMAYLMESMELLNEKVHPAIIDKAAVNFGMPMGPIELADTVGLDICLSIAEFLAKYYGGTVPAHLKELVGQGHLGKKSGQGFYHYKNGKLVKQTPDLDKVDPEITDRLILRLLNEAMACLREKIVADGDLLDAGMIFGTGFAPFRGGPIQYACATGLTTLREKLVRLEQRYGTRFKPDAEWNQSCGTNRGTENVNTEIA